MKKLHCKHGHKAFLPHYLDCVTTEPTHKRFFGGDERFQSVIEVDIKTGIAYTRGIGFSLEEDEFVR